MKKFIKITCLILTLTVFAGMAMGSGSSSDDKKSEITTDGKGENGNSQNNSGDKAEVTSIEQQVLLDRDGIKITAKEYVQDEIFGDGIKVLVENNTDKGVTVGCTALIVNNYMITDLFASTVEAGKKANETIHLMSSELEAAGIKNVGQIELYFHAYDSDSYDELFKADKVVIKTSAFDKMDTTPNDEGTELFKKDGIRIVGKFVDENSFWGTSVLLYLENSTDQNITVACDNMSINGFMVTPVFVSTIYAGKMAVDNITILSSDLKENDITSVDEIELSFRIYNSDTLETIVNTDPINFKTK